MLRGLVPVLLALTACSSTARVIRVDTGEGEPIVFTPRIRGEPVTLNAGEVKRALAELAREMNVPLAPQEAARRLFEVGERSGWYQYNPRNNRLAPLGRGEHLQAELSAAEAEITRSYLAQCERRGTPGDCLRLLVESPTVTGDGRYALAMAFAKGAVLDEMKDAFKAMANPEAVLTAAELRQAGERYGQVMGRNAARAFVMLATAAIGNTAAGLATKVPRLPSAAQAATQAGTQLGIRLSAVGAVTAVTVSADAVTVSVAAGAVMHMTAHGGVPAGSSASAQEQGAKPERTTTAKEPPSIRSRLRDAGLPGGGESTQVGPFRYRPATVTDPGTRSLKQTAATSTGSVTSGGRDRTTAIPRSRSPSNGMFSYRPLAVSTSGNSGLVKRATSMSPRTALSLTDSRHDPERRPRHRN